MALRICDWKYGKNWVYSITYDEALADLHRFAIPHHEEFGIPGHVEVVGQQIGEIRNIGTSSFNGYRHMNGDELKDLLARGWGVGNHGWSHHFIRPDMVDQEIRLSRDVIEQAIGAPVLLYCAPNGIENMSDYVLDACRQLGYLGAMSITDWVNAASDELYYLNRTPLHESYEEPFYSAYDPFRHILLAQESKGWIIDYCHCPLEQAVHPNKDCSEAQLRLRLQTIIEEGGDQVWCAVPEEVISYHLCRRHAVVETVAATAREQRYRIRYEALSARVERRELTFEVEVPAAWCNFPRVWVNGVPQSASVVRPRLLRTTVEVEDGTELLFRPLTF